MTSPPEWLLELTNRTTAEIAAFDVLSPLGCHYFRDERKDVWEVTVFASSTEIIGGERDGEHTHSRFALDLRQMSALLDELWSFHWQALPLGPDDDLGPHVSLEGRHAGHHVWLRILASPPKHFEPGRYINVYERSIDDLW